MALFRTSFPSGDFAPLFRLLDDYDAHRSNHDQSSLRSFSPRFDVRERNDAYHLDGELPGISQENIKIEFSDPQTLVVQGLTEREYHTEPQVESEDDQTVAKPPDAGADRFWVSERTVGHFQRTFSFPSHVDQDAVKASLKNGILSIVIPKVKPGTSKKIPIEWR